VTTTHVADTALAGVAATRVDRRRSGSDPLLIARQLRDTPPAFPFGWFAVAFSGELRAEQILTRRFVDREIVIFRTRSGIARAIEAYCPHLGAHFGHGGTVQGEELRCPFHGFRYSLSGSCVHSPYGVPPRAARLGLLELREICGVIMVWHGPAGQPPWEVQPPEDESGWRPIRHRIVKVRSHPQEVAENSVDFGHLNAVHGFQNVKLIEPLTVDGPRLSTRLSFVRPVPFMRGIRTELQIQIQGLGFSLVEVGITGGWATRQLVLTTPVGERETFVYVGTTVRERGRSILGKTIWNSVEAVVGRAVLNEVVRQVLRDRLIWENKKYLGRPAIAAGDGPIAKYRAWAKQFYPETTG
jgi:nitrite reductase/ring-hydroxylating ferredoxin subunit